MLEFKPMSLFDIEIIRPFFEKQTNRTCDCTIGGSYMWREFFKSEFTVFEKTLFFKVQIDGEIAFAFPIGKNVAQSLKQIEVYCNVNKLPLLFCTVTKKDLLLLQDTYSNLEFYSQRNWFDYLYLFSDIVELTGKRYSGQRNHINKFKRLYPEYSFERITDENIYFAKEFITNFLTGYKKQTETSKEESDKTFEVLQNYNIYGLVGGILKVSGNVVGISIGEIVNDTLFIHIEKADLSYQGIYEVLNNEFAKFLISPQVKYINREEDVGDEGLRISKMSYHPIELVEKFSVRVKNE